MPLVRLDELDGVAGPPCLLRICAAHLGGHRIVAALDESWGHRWPCRRHAVAHRSGPVGSSAESSSGAAAEAQPPGLTRSTTLPRDGQRRRSAATQSARCPPRLERDERLLDPAMALARRRTSSAAAFRADPTVPDVQAVAARGDDAQRLHQVGTAYGRARSRRAPPPPRGARPGAYTSTYWSRCFAVRLTGDLTRPTRHEGTRRMRAGWRRACIARAGTRGAGCARSAPVECARHVHVDDEQSGA